MMYTHVSRDIGSPIIIKITIYSSCFKLSFLCLAYVCCKDLNIEVLF